MMKEIRWSLLTAIDGNLKHHGTENSVECLRAWQPHVIEWLDEQLKVNRHTVMVILEAFMAQITDEENAQNDCPPFSQAAEIMEPVDHYVSPYEWQGMDKDIGPVDLRRDDTFYADCDPWTEEKEDDDPEIPEDTS